MQITRKSFLFITVCFCFMVIGTFPVWSASIGVSVIVFGPNATGECLRVTNPDGGEFADLVPVPCNNISADGEPLNLASSAFICEGTPPFHTIQLLSNSKCGRHCC